MGRRVEQSWSIPTPSRRSTLRNNYAERDARQQEATVRVEAPYWLVLPRVIRGFEGDDGDSGSSSGAGGSGDDSDGDDGDDDKAGKDKDTKTGGDDGLKKALAAERAARKKAEKDAKELREFKEAKELEGKDAAEKATASAEKASKQAAAAMEALRRTASRAAVLAVVREHPFKDPERVAKVLASDLPTDFFELDEDSMELTFDEDKLKELAKAEAKSGAHRMTEDDERDDETDDEAPKPPKSGSAHGGRRDRDTTKVTDEDIRKKYRIPGATPQLP